MCVCVTKTRLFAVLPLENRHEIALYRSASQFIFFERCLESSDESSVEYYGHGFLIACTAPRGIEHYGNWVCRPTTSLRERWRQISSPSKRQELGCGTDSRSIPDSQSQQPAVFYRMTHTHMHRRTQSLS